MTKSWFRHRPTALLLVPILLALALQNTSAQKASTDAQRLRKIEAYVEQARKNWNVPGLGLAIVKNDTVILAKGFGTRTIGQNEPVDEHTLFAIGSSSKAFTSAAIAMLVDEKKVSWDDRATKHLPNLKFHDDYVTHEIRVRDLLSHVSGLPRYDQLWSLFNYTPQEIIGKIQYLEPTATFRSTWQYQNLMFLASGEVIRAASGMSWDDFVARRLFEPLGMKRSSTSITRLKGMSNVATPHARTDDRTRAIPYKNIDNIGPAGSINSSVREMSEWVRLQLSGGVHDGKRLLSDSVVREMHKPHSIMPRTAAAERANPYSHFSAYGLAWMLEDHRGRKLVHHGGNIDGMTAMVAMMPGEKVGFVLLENLAGSGMRTPLMYYIFDRFMDAEERDWSGEALTRAGEARARAAAAARDSAGGTGGSPPRIAGTQPSRPLARYAATYDNPMYGAVVITEENGKLVLRAGNGPAIHGELEHWHFDTFRTRTLIVGAPPESGRMMVTFALDARGEPRSLTLAALGEFRRVARPGN